MQIHTHTTPRIYTHTTPTHVCIRTMAGVYTHTCIRIIAGVYPGTHIYVYIHTHIRIHIHTHIRTGSLRNSPHQGRAPKISKIPGANIPNQHAQMPTSALTWVIYIYIHIYI
jgi:hypothetical protein